MVALSSAGSALAFQELPPGAQLNDDLGAGIDKQLGVSGEDPSNADVVGGTLSAGAAVIPWAVFRQQESVGAHDQLFSRSFAGGAWTTRGSGTVGGRSSADPLFSGSLNFDQSQDGEAPAIDFAGSGRTVPWATWYESTTGLGHDNVFASRFDDSGDANQGKWIFAGQARGLGGGVVPIPSLNIHTEQDAENSSVAGGSTLDPTKPNPWVTWQETTPGSGKDQIFVERSIGPGQANCDGVKPLGVAVGPDIPAIGGFCWQQTGIPRVGSGPDPSLNVDPTRDGIEPDIAFAGSQDGTPWVVWYETGPSAVGLHGNEMVFAAEAESDGVGANGGFHWVAVGNQLSATLDTSATNGFGKCAESAGNEGQCSLNESPGDDAEAPRVAAGTMSSANPTSPWVAWDEARGGIKQIFVSRLVGAGANAHFEIANGGQPISSGSNDSTRPDIAFSGNTPYVTWREDVGAGVEKGFSGHFVDASNPTFVTDEGDVPLTPSAQASVREPISSSCIATPLDSDGAACKGGALGTPFFLFTDGASPLALFADAYQPETPITGGASGIGASSATITGSVDPRGAAVSVSFQYGATSAYGQATPAQSSGASNATMPFAVQLTGLPTGAAIHYRIMVSSDFGTSFGSDQVLTTAAAQPLLSLLSPPSGPIAATLGHGAAVARSSGTSAEVRLTCAGAAAATCRIALELTVTETFVHKLVAVSASSHVRRVHKLVRVGSASATLQGGQTRLVRIALNKTGKRLLKSLHTLRVRLRATQAGADGRFAPVASQVLTFKLPKRHK
jgi:hypothetical protein